MQIIFVLRIHFISRRPYALIIIIKNPAVVHKARNAYGPLYRSQVEWLYETDSKLISEKIMTMSKRLAIVVSDFKCRSCKISWSTFLKTNIHRSNSTLGDGIHNFNFRKPLNDTQLDQRKI